MTPPPVDPPGLAKRFAEQFRRPPLHIVRAPGRVNVIGEHTDYNEGFVLPAAIDRYCYAAAAPRADSRIVCRSLDIDDEFEATEEMPPPHSWRCYVAGVVALLRARGISTGADLLIRSEVPLGAGLSSSAALETSVATALLQVGGQALPSTVVAQLCQRAEHEFAGVACGIMDQYVAVHARRGTALLLDCRSLVHRFVPLPTGVRLVICDSLVRHAHAAGEYNRRRQECREALQLVAVRWPHVTALRDIEIEMLPEVREVIGERLFRRVRHVVTENARVVDTARALDEGDLARVGQALPASHESLRTDYQVSCPELDALVEVALRQPGVHGARMTGGGFGGCTIALVEAAAVAGFEVRTRREYGEATGRDTEIYVAAPAQGAGAVEW